LAVPTQVVDFLAAQLAIADPTCIKQYAARPATQWEHTAELSDTFGYRNFSDPTAAEQLRAFLTARAWTRIEPSKALFAAAVRWLREHRVLLPGVHALAKLVAEVRTAAETRVWDTITAAATATDVELPRRLDGLLKVPQGARVSELERFRRGPTRISGRELVGALDRAGELAGLGAGAVDLAAVPANRIEVLTRDGLTTKPRCLTAAPTPGGPWRWWPPAPSLPADSPRRRRLVRTHAHGPVRPRQHPQPLHLRQRQRRSRRRRPRGTDPARRRNR